MAVRVSFSSIHVCIRSGVHTRESVVYYLPANRIPIFLLTATQVLIHTNLPIEIIAWSILTCPKSGPLSIICTAALMQYRWCASLRSS